MEKSGFFSVGKIVGVHGVKGIVKVLSYSGSVEMFTDPGEMYLCGPDGQEKACEIERANPHKNIILVTLKGVSDRETARALIGSVFFADEASLPDLENGAYYFRDLIGLSVVTAQGELLGRIESIIETGSNDVYVVRKDEREVLIPALESVVKEIDLEGKSMLVDLPQGL